MDIQEWLDKTVLPQQPPSPLEPCSETHPPYVEPIGHASHQRHRRRRPTSDSSLLEALPPRKKAAPVESEHRLGADADESAESDASHPAAHTESSASSRPYRRRPRRKTRPDRYDPVPKHVQKRGKHTQRLSKGESKRTKRRSRRSNVDKPDSAIVQGFHAKNVPQDRLTLKPQEKPGLFAKGRASTPVKGRGLPDLVFSEMKFLQKHKDQPEAEPPLGSSKKQRKKDHAHAEEEEISAYFNTVRPALAEKDHNIQAKGGTQQTERPGVDRRERGRQPVIDNVTPTIERGSTASYLGLGSRGPRHETGSCISWSESVRAPSMTLVRRRADVGIHSDHPDSVHGRQEAASLDRQEKFDSRQLLPNEPKSVRNGSDGRFQVSSLPPTTERLSQSHSLPQHAPSPRQVSRLDRAARCRTQESAISPSSILPFVPTVLCDHQHDPLCLHRTAAPSRSNEPVLGHETSVPLVDDGVAELELEQPPAGEKEPQTSSTIGQILQQCNVAFQERRGAEAMQDSEMHEQTSMVPTWDTRTRRHEHYPPIRRMPSVRFARVEEICSPRTPIFSNQSIDERQEHHCGIDNVSLARNDCLRLPGGAQHDYSDGEEHDVDDFDWEQDTEMIGDGIGLDQFDAESSDLEHFEEFPGNLRPVSSTIPTRPRFWRPHRLY